MEKGKPRNLTLLVKPASSLCNMRCRYCFYADEASRRSGTPGVMTPETARRLIDAAFAAVREGGQVTFAFQGGEPTLAGPDFFDAFCRYAREHNTKNLTLSWSVQTNGLLIDSFWAAFFREEGFLVGVSLDGTKALHDACRPDAEGNPTWKRAAAAVALLRKNRVNTNLLCVVTSRSAACSRKVYQTLKATGIPYLQFIPCLDPLPGSPEAPAASRLTAKDYGFFLCRVFDLWWADWTGGQAVNVRQFEDWIRVAVGLPPEMCATCGMCGGYLVAEADGSLYPCDFYALDEWRLGSLEDGEDSILSALRSPRMADFRRRSDEKPSACGRCRFFSLCRGGCSRNRIEQDGRTVNGLCDAFQMFFEYAEPRLREAVRAVRSRAVSLHTPR